MSAMNLKFTNLLAIISLLLAMSCNNNESSEKEVVTPIKEKIPNSATASTLDRFDLSQWEKISDKDSEAGDVSSTFSLYQNISDQAKLGIEHNYSEYGADSTYYLLNRNNKILKVQIKEYDPSLFIKERKVQISEKIIDFTQSPPSMMSKTEKMPHFVARGYADPWISLNFHKDGMSMIFDEGIDIRGEHWYEETKGKLKQTLSFMEKLPKKIPLESVGYDHIGIKKEFRSMAKEAIKEVKKERANGAEVLRYPFIYSIKPLEKTEGSPTDLDINHWKKRYGENLKE